MILNSILYNNFFISTSVMIVIESRSSSSLNRRIMNHLHFISNIGMNSNLIACFLLINFLKYYNSLTGKLTCINSKTYFNITFNGICSKLGLTGNSHIITILILNKNRSVCLSIIQCTLYNIRSTLYKTFI